MPDPELRDKVIGEIPGFNTTIAQEFQSVERGKPLELKVPGSVADQVVHDLIQLLPWGDLVDIRSNQPLTEGIGMRIVPFNGHYTCGGIEEDWVAPVILVGPEDILTRLTAISVSEGHVREMILQTQGLDLGYDHTILSFEPSGFVGHREDIPSRTDEKVRDAHTLDLYVSGTDRVGAFSRVFYSLEWAPERSNIPDAILVPVGVQSEGSFQIEPVNVYLHPKLLTDEARSRATHRGKVGEYDPFL
jgi:hypothetical protein